MAAIERWHDRVNGLCWAHVDMDLILSSEVRWCCGIPEGMFQGEYNKFLGESSRIAKRHMNIIIKCSSHS